MATFSTVDEYISTFASPQKEILEEMRKIISDAVPPETTETISYQIPTYKYKGNLIHFAGFKNHIGIYPGPNAIDFFAEELKPYKTNKGTIQIPWNLPLPLKLIQDIVAYNADLLKDKKGPGWHNYREKWADAEEIMQQIIVETPLEKSFKWGMDVYTYQGKNVVAWSGFKDFFSVWFYNGYFLADKEQVLVSGSEGKTKSLRQWRFKSAGEMDPAKISAYIEEAIQTVIDGKEILPEKSQPLAPAGLLLAALENNEELFRQFRSLTPGKQKDYILYIEDAKQEKTKLSRIEKIIPLILEGKGLNDKYKR